MGLILLPAKATINQLPGRLEGEGYARGHQPGEVQRLSVVYPGLSDRVHHRTPGNQAAGDAEGLYPLRRVQGRVREWSDRDPIENLSFVFARSRRLFSES